MIPRAEVSSSITRSTLQRYAGRSERMVTSRLPLHWAPNSAPAFASLGCRRWWSFDRRCTYFQGVRRASRG